jgi:predicted nucleotidyltransferase
MYLDNYRDRLPSICRKYNVKALYAFGSVLTDRFGPDSDVDLIVAFDDAVEDLFITFFDLKYSLEELFNRSVERTKQLIYGRAN